MAQYTITHDCGHDSTRQMYGKGSERERKAEWLASQDCPKCWAAKKREKEDKLPITAEIYCNGLDTDTDGNLLAEIVLTGGTRVHKERISAAGYIWREVRGGMMDMLSMHAAPRAWVKDVLLSNIIKRVDQSDPPEAATIKAELDLLGVAKINNNISPLDIAMLQKKMKDMSTQKQAIATIEKPMQPACYPAGKWNGKIYGNNQRGYTIYINNKQIILSASDYNELTSYLSALADYNNKVAAIKEAKNEN